MTWNMSMRQIQKEKKSGRGNIVFHVTVDHLSTVNQVLNKLGEPMIKIYILLTDTVNLKLPCSLQDYKSLVLFSCNSDIYLISAWGSGAHRECSNMNKVACNENHCSRQIPASWLQSDTVRVTGISNNGASLKFGWLTKDEAGVAFIRLFCTFSLIEWKFSIDLRPSNLNLAQSQCKTRKCGPTSVCSDFL